MAQLAALDAQLVPAADPTDTQAKLIVTKGGVRNDQGTVDGLAGATFSFWKVSSASAVDGGTDTRRSCTTGTDGKCSVIVDLVGSNANYFYAKETAAPAGWALSDTWGGGSDYLRYHSGPLKSKGSVLSRTAYMPSTGRTWPNVRDNQPAPQKCGIKMAVVFDLSYSVTGDSALMTKYRTAGKSFIDALAGTPSQVAIKTFASQAPAASATNKPRSNNGMPLTSVAQDAGAKALKANIDGFTTPPTGKYSTNWDAGLDSVGDGYDVVLFLTDGDPTTYRVGTANNNSYTPILQATEEAIHSANKVKKSGAQLIAVGIGGSVDTNAGKKRLSLIANKDSFVTGFDTLGAELTKLATKDCEGIVTIVKSIQGGDGKETPGANWTFGTTTKPQVTAGTGTSLTGTTDVNGTLNFKVGGFDETNPVRNVEFFEDQKPGFALFKQDGFNAKCTNRTANGANVPVANSGTLGFTLNVPKASAITCKVINKKLAADVSIVKAAPKYNGGKPVTGPGSAPEVPAGTRVDWEYTVTNTGSLPLTDIEVLDDPVGIVSCPKTVLPVNDLTTLNHSMTCTASGPVTAQN